jgi:hypothetical protein
VPGKRIRIPSQDERFLGSRLASRFHLSSRVCRLEHDLEDQRSVMFEAREVDLEEGSDGPIRAAWR